jgi:hypothetical protein
MKLNLDLKSKVHRSAQTTETRYHSSDTLKVIIPIEKYIMSYMVNNNEIVNYVATQAESFSKWINRQKKWTTELVKQYNSNLVTHHPYLISFRVTTSMEMNKFHQKLHYLALHWEGKNLIIRHQQCHACNHVK